MNSRQDVSFFDDFIRNSLESGGIYSYSGTVTKQDLENGAIKIGGIANAGIMIYNTLWKRSKNLCLEIRMQMKDDIALHGLSYIRLKDTSNVWIGLMFEPFVHPNYRCGWGGLQFDSGVPIDLDTYHVHKLVVKSDDCMDYFIDNMDTPKVTTSAIPNADNLLRLYCDSLVSNGVYGHYIIDYLKVCQDR